MVPSTGWKVSSYGVDLYACLLSVRELDTVRFRFWTVLNGFSTVFECKFLNLIFSTVKRSINKNSILRGNSSKFTVKLIPKDDVKIFDTQWQVDPLNENNRFFIQKSCDHLASRKLHVCALSVCWKLNQNGKEWQLFIGVSLGLHLSLTLETDHTYFAAWIVFCRCGGQVFYEFSSSK